MGKQEECALGNFEVKVAPCFDRWFYVNIANNVLVSLETIQDSTL